MPEGTAGRDGPRRLPSRVPTSAIDRIVKEGVRSRGGRRGRPAIPAGASDAIGRVGSPREATTPAAVPTCFLSYAPAARSVRRFPREPPPRGPAGASRPDRVTPDPTPRLVVRFASAASILPKAGRDVNSDLTPAAPRGSRNPRLPIRQAAGSPVGPICRIGRDAPGWADPAAGPARTISLKSMPFMSLMRRFGIWHWACNLERAWGAASGPA
jgi:hypothetical protein